jgi:hypothetical protein
VEFVLAVMLAAATGLVVNRVGGKVPGGFFGGFTRLVGGYRPDGWPTGIQEEDRDLPWGRTGPLASRDTSPPPVPNPTLTRARPTVHPR